MFITCKYLQMAATAWTSAIFFTSPLFYCDCSATVEDTHRRVAKVPQRMYTCIYTSLISLTLNTSHVAENGSTANPTNKSATAKLTMKKFVTLRNLWEQNTAAITKQLPTITSTLINASTASDIKFPGSVHCTESISVQLFIASLPPYAERYLFTTYVFVCFSLSFHYFRSGCCCCRFCFRFSKIV